MRNVVGGVEDTGLSFKLTPPPGAAGLGGSRTPTLTPTLTPPKALLMNQVHSAGGCVAKLGNGWAGGGWPVAAAVQGTAGGVLCGAAHHALNTAAPARPQERKMNMISPLAGSSLWHADIETGKVGPGFSSVAFACG